MKLEHLALNLPDPDAFSRWYVQHVGMKLVRSSPPPMNGRFLADASGAVMLEVYQNAAAPVPDYAAQNPLTLHVAFIAADVPAEAARLQAAGATLHDGPTTTPDGDVVCMLRDPWGVGLQLVQRANRMV
ncbi:MAG: VOC family protein [Phycisphaerae bacterium]